MLLWFSFFNFDKLLIGLPPAPATAETAGRGRTLWRRARGVVIRAAVLRAGLAQIARVILAIQGGDVLGAILGTNIRRLVAKASGSARAIAGRVQPVNVRSAATLSAARCPVPRFPWRRRAQEINHKHFIEIKNENQRSTV